MLNSRLKAELGRVDRFIAELTQSGKVRAAAICVGRSGSILHVSSHGLLSPEQGTHQVTEDSLFLVASLAKPITVTALMMLVECGLVRLDDRVCEYVPAFARNEKHEVRLRHLMTHTSGLPDMAPDNLTLRARHAPLAEFISSICEAPLGFVPGSRVSYQSTGIAILAAVVEAVSGETLPAFLERHLFAPLKMSSTSLGAKPESLDRIASVRLDSEQLGTDWHWNTPYWLGLGAPWGGLITSPVEYGRFCRMMLNEGTLDGVRILSPATVRAMTSNQLEGMPAIPEEDRRCRPWGLGWRLNWPGSSSNFGDLLGPRTYGHWGATGTLCWIDPVADAFLVLFTTEPGGEEGRHLAAASNMVAASFHSP